MTSTNGRHGKVWSLETRTNNRLVRAAVCRSSYNAGLIPVVQDLKCQVKGFDPQLATQGFSSRVDLLKEWADGFQVGESAETIERCQQEPKLGLWQLVNGLLCLAFARDLGRVTFSKEKHKNDFILWQTLSKQMSHGRKRNMGWHERLTTGSCP